MHRKRERYWLRAILLDPHHSVEVIGLIAPLLYAIFIWWKGSLHLFDGFILIGLYLAYLLVLIALPPEGHEGIEDLGALPRRIVLAPKLWRIAGIVLCFAVGGILIYFVAEPFLGSLISLAAAFGIPAFVTIQWLAPLISEFPEFLSTFYFARQEEKAPIALMNVASSNLNQWTLLFGMLPIVFSLGRGSISAISFDAEQRAELMLTIAQSLVALAFLANMRFSWLEAVSMLALFLAQFVIPHFFGPGSKVWITDAFLLWFGLEVLAMFLRRRLPAAITEFASTWRDHVRGPLSVAQIDQRDAHQNHGKTADFEKGERLFEEDPRPQDGPEVAKRNHGIKHRQLPLRNTHHVEHGRQADTARCPCQPIIREQSRDAAAQVFRSEF